MEEDRPLEGEKTGNNQQPSDLVNVQDHDVGGGDSASTHQGQGSGTNPPWRPGYKIAKKKSDDDIKGVSKRRKTDSKFDCEKVDSVADDTAREQNARAPSSSDESSESSSSDSEKSGKNSDDSDVSISGGSDFDDGEESPAPAPVPAPAPAKARAAPSRPAYSRFDPVVDDEVTVTLPTADMNEYATKLFTTFVSDKKLKEMITADYPVPKGVPGLKTPSVDDYIPEIFSVKKQDYGKYADEDWAKVQNRTLDVMGPLSRL